MVDGELLFFFAQLFPDTLCLGDVLFGELQDVVVVVPEEAELFVAGFFLLELSAGSRNGHIYPAIIIDDADVQGGKTGSYCPLKSKLKNPPSAN